MNRVLHCHCGYAARGEDEEALVSDVRRHAWDAHGMALGRDDALLLAFRAELDQEAPSTIARRSMHSDQEEER